MVERRWSWRGLPVWPAALLIWWAVVSRGQVHGHRPVVKLGVILPNQDDSKWSLKKVSPAISLAVQTLSGPLNILPGYDIQVRLGDSECSEVTGPLVAIDMYAKGLADVFLGPACDYALAPVARFSPHWNIPILTAGGLLSPFHNKHTYSLLTRMAAPLAHVGPVFQSIFETFGWVVPSLIYERYDNRKLSDCFDIAQSLYMTQRRRVEASHPGVDIWYQQLDRTTQQSSADSTVSILEEATMHSRSRQTTTFLSIFSDFYNITAKGY